MIGAAHGSVVELGNKLVAGLLGERSDGFVRIICIIIFISVSCCLRSVI
jgi:hypothetical protein